jgi:hypothetical protein
MGQKIPLFSGVIASLEAVPSPGTTLDVFTPPDKTSKVPAIYEVHLFMSPRSANGPAVDGPVYKLRAQSDVDVGVVWQCPHTASAAVGFVDRAPISKILDGFPVRGDVKLSLNADGVAAPGDPAFIWGYVHRIGEGRLKQAERRPIGKALAGFNAGMPFTLLPGADVVVHTFAKNRIDEISLAAVFLDTTGTGETVSLIFEDANNVPVAPAATFRPQKSNTYSLDAAGGVVLPPFGGLFPSSPYFIHQCPFGGGYIPTLDHLRIKNNSAGTAASIHGYFTRG